MTAFDNDLRLQEAGSGGGNSSLRDEQEENSFRD